MDPVNNSVPELMADRDQFDAIPTTLIERIRLADYENENQLEMGWDETDGNSGALVRDRPVVLCSSVNEVKEKLKTQEETFTIRAEGFRLVEGYSLSRYLGCFDCTEILDEDYKCHGKQCHKKDDPRGNEVHERKRVYALENLQIMDSANAVLPESLLALNKAVRQLFRKDPEEFENSSYTERDVKSIIQNKRFTLTISAELHSVSIWRLEITDFIALNDDPVPVLNYNVPASYTSQMVEDVRKFLAKMTSFSVTVTRGQGSRKPTGNENEYIRLKKPEGLAVHICILKKREGADHDIPMFEDLYRQLGFQVKTFTDLPLEKKKKKGEEIRNLEECINWCKKTIIEKDYESFVFYLSAHGFHTVVELEDGKTVDIVDRIVYQFDGSNFPEFRGRPKFIAINSCQVFKKDGITTDNTDETGAEADTIIPFKKMVEAFSCCCSCLKRTESQGTPLPESELHPTHEDTFVLMSTSPGYSSWRYASIGTLFMRANAYIFMKFAHQLEIQDMCKMVVEVLTKPGNGQPPQLPEPKNYHFHKKFYFHP